MTSKHVQSVVTAHHWMQHKTLDAVFEGNMEKDVTFWNKVLKRYLVIILSCAKNNIALRGSSDKIGDIHNGNFLSQVEMLSKFDATMKELLLKPTGTVRYLHKDIQNEFIEILCQHVTRDILSEVFDSKYYSLIIDTTQDLAKIDQLSFVLRYIKIKLDKHPSIEINESFLGFFSVNDQTSAGLKDVILELLKSHSIDIHNCRGQGYDGAANMSGAYSGLQSRITELQSNAFYVHCSSHNLNLVVNDAVKEVVDVRAFFETIQSIYVFFGHSISRWDILSQLADSETITLKTLNPTRWAGRVTSLIAIKSRYFDVIKALTKVILTTNKKSTADEANILKSKMDSFEFIILLTFLTEVLSKINTVSVILQTQNFDLSKAVCSLERLKKELQKYREQFPKLLKESKEMASKWGTTTEFKEKRRSKSIGVITDEETVFKINVFFVVLDIVISKLDLRFQGMKNIVVLFEVISPPYLLNLNDNDIKDRCEKLVEIYHSDITSSLATELILMKMSMAHELKEIDTARELADLLFIKNNELLSTFPNVSTLLKIFLTLPVTSASAERSFSKLKLIKNFLRTSMGQERLKGLSVLSIEAERASQIDFESVIRQFARQKSRRLSL